jgi:Protein of unknown function (DUF2934)
MSTTPIHEQIALRAFERYVARGYQNGHDVDDWVWAESSLLAEAGHSHSAGVPSHEHPHHGHDHHQHGAHDTRHRHQD